MIGNMIGYVIFSNKNVMIYHFDNETISMEYKHIKPELLFS